MRRIGMAIVGLCLAGAAWGRDLNRQNYLIGERAAGMGGAFVALTGDAASSYYNPAGLAGLGRHGLSLSASVYQAQWETYQDLLDLGIGLVADMRSQTFSTFPGSIVYSLQLGGDPDPAAVRHVAAVSVLVPDWDSFEGVLDRPRGLLPFEMKGTFLNQDQTYWVGPSYAVSLGAWRLGVSVFVLAHLTTNRSNLGLKTTLEPTPGAPINLYTASTMERSAWGITMLAQAGVQWDATEHLRLGFSLRSPTFGMFHSSVKTLVFNSFYAEDPDGNPVVSPELRGYVDRIETDQGELDFRLPLKLALGVGWDVPGSYAVALDLACHLPQAGYQRFSGPLVYPKDPMGQDIVDPARAWDPREEVQNTWVLDVNLGAEVTVVDGWTLRGGLFTDLSVVDQHYYEQDPERRADAVVLPFLYRFGASLAVGMTGEKSTTTLGLTYVYGFGDTFGLNELFGEPQGQVDVTAHTLSVILAGSADL